ncbi:MAG: PAS domain S-box protein [Bacteroidota bacterium]|nr:PAS domain S-box protein [Bacteroidota bacterium]
MNTLSEYISETSEDKFQNLISQAPVLIVTFEGPSFIVKTINKMALNIWGKSYGEVINKPLLESSPELEDGLKNLLTGVFTTGEPFISNEIPVQLKRRGKPDSTYFNSIYQPLRDAYNKIYGIILIGTEITEAVTTRKLVEESEILSRTILESSPDCLKVLDLEGRLQYMNYNGLCQMEIDDFSTFKNKYWCTLWGGENEALIKASIDKAKKGETAKFTAFYPTAKGTPKWWDVVVSPVRKTGEPVLQIVSVSRDITEQKNSQEAIDKIGSHLKLATDSANLGVWSLNMQSQELEWTALHKKMWGYDEHRTDLTYEDWHKLIVPEDKELAFKRVQEASINHSFYEVEYRIKRANDNVIRWMKSVGQYYYNTAGEAVTLTGTSIDITEQKSFTEELEKKVAGRTKELGVRTKQLETLNEALNENIQLVIQQDKTIEKIKEFTFLADSIPQIIFTSRPDGYLDYYNRHWIEYTGMTIEETQGWGWGPVLHPDDLQQCIDVWTESITTGKPYEIEYRFKRASDGMYRWHLGRALPMRNDQGEIVKWFGSCTDIDAYKQALDLENKIGQFEDFNRIVAHNLRGPAGSIDMIIGMLAEAGSEEERKEMIGMLKSTSVSLNTTLNELMQVLEVRFNKNMTYDKCNLKELVEETENMMRGQMISKQAIITTNFAVPNIEFPLIYMKSIFYNMISNSLKYSHAGVPALIGVSTKKHLGKTVLEFTDNGLGIDLQKHGKNMFKLNKVFHSGFDSKGVGLFMTKTQIETFGGTISAESEPGNGTKFIVTL